MTIEELLKNTGAKLFLGGCWLVWLHTGEEGEWAVYQKQYNAKEAVCLYSGVFPIAIEVFRKMGQVVC